jgi:hypothetical protein
VGNHTSAPPITSKHSHCIVHPGVNGFIIYRVKLPTIGKILYKISDPVVHNSKQGILFQTNKNATAKVRDIMANKHLRVYLLE